MRQFADGGYTRLSQKTSQESPTLSDMSTPPTAFSMNQNSAVCLPLVFQSKKLIWVHSHQVDLHLQGAAELDEAFDRFPYLTHRQTAALAQRCSLHPDQVRVWFMAQRLRYGISWDYNDIQEVRKKFRSVQENAQGKKKLPNRMEGEVKEDRGQKKKQKKKVEPGAKKAGEVWEEHSAKEGGMIGESVRVSEQLQRETKQEQSMTRDKDRKVEDKSNLLKKRKRMTAPEKMGEKRMMQDPQSEATLYPRKKKAKVKEKFTSIQEGPAHKSVVVPDAPLDASSVLSLQSQTQTFNAPPLTDSQTDLLIKADVPSSTPNICMTSGNRSVEGKTETEAGLVTDIAKLKELIEGNNGLDVAHSPPTFARKQASRAVDACTSLTRIRCYAKTQSQLAEMRMTFSHCQYPDNEQYNRLATLIGIPRYVLVQWFADMRYYIKKGRPRWMSQEQHSQALAHIKYRQYMHMLATVQPSEEDATWVMQLERSNCCDKEESVKVPPEEK